MDIKDTRKYGLYFFSQGKKCELSCFCAGDEIIEPFAMRIPLDIKEATMLYEVLGRWIEKRTNK